MSKKRTFNPKNCQNSVRAVVKSKGVTISLLGKHAHEWTIIRKEPDLTIVTTYPDRILASSEFKKYKKAYGFKK